MYKHSHICVYLCIYTHPQWWEFNKYDSVSTNYVCIGEKLVCPTHFLKEISLYALSWFLVLKLLFISL